MSAARITSALIFVALACFAIGIGIGASLAIAPTDSSVQNVASPPIPDGPPEPLGVLQVAPGAPVPGPVLRLAVPIRQLPRPKAEEPPAAPPPKPAEPTAPLPKPPVPTAPPVAAAAEPATHNSPCYHASCRRGLFRRR